MHVLLIDLFIVGGATFLAYGVSASYTKLNK